MGKQNHEVTYKCGHTGMVLCRESNIGFFLREDCPDCHKKILNAKAAGTYKPEIVIPECRAQLVGSEKQIEWANWLREEIMTKLEKVLKPEDERAIKIMAHLNGITKASWWIDHKTYQGTEGAAFNLAKKVGKEII